MPGREKSGAGEPMASVGCSSSAARMFNESNNSVDASAKFREDMALLLQLLVYGEVYHVSFVGPGTAVGHDRREVVIAGGKWQTVPQREHIILVTSGVFRLSLAGIRQRRTHTPN